MYPRRIRLQCGFTLGDIVALTGAVRELHEQYPSAFETDVETSAPEVWWHNPYVTRPPTPAQVVECDKVLIDRTGARGKHYIAAYLDLLNAQLGNSAGTAAYRGRYSFVSAGKGLVRISGIFAARNFPSGSSVRAESSTFRSSGGLTTATKKSLIIFAGASNLSRSAIGGITIRSWKGRSTSEGRRKSVI